MSQSYASNLKESDASIGSEEGRILRFLIERSEFIKIKKKSPQKGASLQENWLEISSVARQYLQLGFSVSLSSAYLTDELKDRDDFTVSSWA